MPRKKTDATPAPETVTAYKGFNIGLKVTPDLRNPYVRRVMDEIVCEQHAEYAELREGEMQKIVRECERERGSNSVNLREADWSDAFEEFWSRPRTSILSRLLSFLPMARVKAREVEAAG